MVGRWDRQLTHDFVKKYVELDVLWNVNNPLRKSAKARMKAYQTLQQLVQPLDSNFSIADVRNKIKGFRSVYCMELKKIQQSKNQAYVPSLPWFKMMDDVLHGPAMDNIVKKRNTLQDSVSYIRVKNKLKPVKTLKTDTQYEEPKNPLESDYNPSAIKIENEEMIEVTPINIQIIDEFNSQSIETNNTPNIKSNNNNFPSPSIQYKLRTHQTHSLPQHHSSTSLSTKSTKSIIEFDDEFELFGKSVAIQLRKLPLNQSLKAEIDIQTLLMDARLKSNSLSSIRQLTSSSVQQQPSSTILTPSSYVDDECDENEDYNHLG